MSGITLLTYFHVLHVLLVLFIWGCSRIILPYLYHSFIFFIYNIR